MGSRVNPPEDHHGSGGTTDLSTQTLDETWIAL